MEADSRVADKLKELATATGSQINFETAEDNSYIDCSIIKEGIELDLLLTKFEEYCAYDLSSPGLPREIYSDQLRPGVTASQRSEEIVNNASALMTRQQVFHPTPRFFNRNRGYILLPIDGSNTKIPLKTNYFGLPIPQ